ncbi:MAG: TolC family protein [Pyrinomonadaceae bacterium]
MKFSRSLSVLPLLVLVGSASMGVVASPQDLPAMPVKDAVATVVPDNAPLTVPNAYSPLNLNRVGIQTAQPIPLTLSDAVRRALQNNNDIEISRDDARFQETQVRALLGVYDPVLTLQPNYSRSSTTGSSATNDFRVGADFTGLIRRGGGNYSGFFNNSRTENAFAQAQASSGSLSGGGSALFTSSLGFNYTQPLLRNFRIDNNRRQITIARRRLEQTDTDFRLRATDTLTAVQRAYWDFVFSLRNQQNQVANVNFARENLRQIEARIEAGASAPVARAEVATELANREGELLLATQQVSINENNLKQLVLRDPNAFEWSQTFVPTDAPTVSLTSVSLENALKDATDNRFELKRLRLQREINEQDLRFFRNQTKPQLDFNSTFSLDGLSRGGATTSTTLVPQFFGNDEILRQRLNTLLPAANQIPNPDVAIAGAPGFLSGGFNRSLLNIFRTDAPNFRLGVTFSFPLRNRTAKANLAGAQIQERQIQAQTRGQEQVVIVEVRNAVQAVETTRQRVFTARRARENAEIQLEGERRLFEAGRSTTFLLFQRENALTNARNAEIRAETDHNKSLADLQRATSTAFRENNIIVDSPVPVIPR